MRKMIIFFLLMSLSATLFAQPIRELVFFGDSLSDNGNLYRKVKLIPKSPPYYNGQFSNGLVWSEHLRVLFQEKYGIKSQNYAVGGATALKSGPLKGSMPYNLKKEVTNYLKSQSTTDKNSVLYFVWMGANDYMDDKKTEPSALVNAVMDEIVLQIRVLIENGGKNFVLIDLPDFSKAPFVKEVSQEQKSRLQLLSHLNHQKMLEVVSMLTNAYPNFHFVYVDIFTIFNDILVNTQSYNLKYHTHIVNLSDSCWLGGYRFAKDDGYAGLADDIQYSTALSIAHDVGISQSLGEAACSNPDDYMFWDKVHPTAAVHHVLASIMGEALEQKFAFYALDEVHK